MSYHDKRNPVAGHGRASESVHADRLNASEVKPQRDDKLRHKIERNRLRHELIGLPDEEHEQLVNEVAEFKRLCAALSWSPSGRRRG